MNAASGTDWHLSEMRKFAESLPDDLGPMFGRDVCRLLTDHAKALRDIERLRSELLRVDARLREVLNANA